MIEEEYVSFETAKLLKEKGFNEKVICYYDDGGSLNLNKFVEFQCCNEGYGSGVFAAPTLQIAMKWLLKAHKLFVNVCPSVEGYYWTEKWHSYVDNLEKRYPFGKFIGTFNTHEQACEAAIKYCLENLI